jgi:hypothetical protein
VPTAIKRALVARDKSCAFPGRYRFYHSTVTRGSIFPSSST